MTRPPNILVIVTDDQRRPETMEVMPQTVGWFHTGEVPGRAPVTGGTDYPNAVCTTPLCAPSRTSILTGRYAHNHGVWNNDGGVEADPRTLLQERLRNSEAGYRTGIFGKYKNKWVETHPAPAGPPGFDRWSIFDGGQYSPATVNEQGVTRTVLQYSTDYFADQAIRFLDEEAGGDKPWFLYVAPATPHTPFTPDPKYADAPIPPFRAPPSYFDPDRRDKPYWVRWVFADPPYVEEARAAQLRMLRSADDLVDRVMAKIAELGEDANTLAFFTADHGMHWGEHGLDTKASTYLESVRVPFYVRWPERIGPGESDPALAANIDIAPTALEAAGLRNEEPLDGRSLLGASPPRGRILTEYDVFRGETAPAAGRQHRKWAALLTPSFHYVETFKPGTEDLIWREYYDLATDPHQLENLLYGRELGEWPPLAALSSQLAADRACHGAGCPGSEAEPAPTPLPVADLRKMPVREADPVKLPPGQTRIRAPLVNRLPGTSVFLALGRADEPPPPDTHIARFECSLDGGPFRRCGRHMILRGLANGDHEFRAVSVDEGGNRDPIPASFEWTTDAVPSWSDDPDTQWPDITGAAMEQPVAVRIVVPDGDGGWFVGGSFGRVGGVPRTNLVHIGADKEVDEPWAPAVDGPVATMALSEDGGTLYLGGAFTSIDGEPRGRLAALDAATGALAPWAPALDGEAIELAVLGGSVYAVGAFTTVAGEPRRAIAEIRAADGKPTGWDPAANAGATGRALRVSGDTLYVGGSGLTEIGGAARRNLAALDRASGRATPWDPSPDADVEALELAPDGGSIFVGGRFKQIASSPKAHAAEVRLADGSPTGWRPVPGYVPAAGRVASVLDFLVADLSASGSEPRWSIVIAGAFDTIKARYQRDQVAEVGKFGDLPGDGYPADWDPKLDSNVAFATPPAVPTVFTVARSGPVLALGGNFFASGFTSRRALAFYREIG